MNPPIFLLLCSLLLFSPAYGQISGNRNSQEARGMGDVDEYMTIHGRFGV